MSYYRIRNWDRFQHYKDRKPPWIKFYVDLLDDEAHRLTDKQFGQLAKLFLLAARTDNAIPADEYMLARLIGTEPEDLELDVFIEKRYLIATTSKRRKRSNWPSRYIPRHVREAVLERDEHRCVLCGASVWLELDHIVPVSAGGQSVSQNLQTLCRSCNRAKRSRVQAGLRSKNVASVLSETETEAEVDIETPQTPLTDEVKNGNIVLLKQMQERLVEKVGM